MSSSPNRRRNLLLLSLTAVLLSVLLAAGFLQTQQASTKAEQATVEHGELLLKQTSLLANPLLLSNDRVSLNYLLNELITLPYIRAAQLETNREGVIARAGDSGGIEMQQALSSKQDSHLSIWLDPTPFAAPMQAQLTTSAMFALLALLGSLITVVMVSRKYPEHNRRAEDYDDYENSAEPTFSPHLTTEPQPAALAPETETETEVEPQPAALPEAIAGQPATDTDTDTEVDMPTPVAQEDAEPQPPEPEDVITLESITPAQPIASIEEMEELNAETLTQPSLRTDTEADTEEDPWLDEFSPATPAEPAAQLTLDPYDSYSEVDDIPFIGELPERISVDDSLQALEQSAIPLESISATEQPAATPEHPQDEGDLQSFVSSIATDPHATDDTPEPAQLHTAGLPELPDDIPFIGGARRGNHPAPADSTAVTTEAARTEPTLETQSLVSLLRPDLHDRSMPQFQPSPSGIDNADPEDEMPDFEETTHPSGFQPGHPEPSFPQTPNPLTTERGKEEQLSLYTMEHELELALTPDDAGYCLYIDTSAHAGNVEEVERQQLLRMYTRLAGQTAALYNGNISELNNGDMFIRFDRALPDDSHGINALCASVLFNLLYKGFNQSRIRAFQPALNLRMSLARGQRTKDQLLLEEARFLTHTTQSNELISHTALTESTILKGKLLKQADIRREDEDKVLIISLTEKVQQLLIKQTEQLLAKLK